MIAYYLDEGANDNSNEGYFLEYNEDALKDISNCDPVKNTQ